MTKICGGAQTMVQGHLCECTMVTVITYYLDLLYSKYKRCNALTTTE